jgi:hypothetical protein
MTLPPKVLQVLATIRAELLSAPLAMPSEPQPPAEKAKAEPKRITARARNARKSNSVFQRACRRREWWTPVH